MLGLNSIYTSHHSCRFKVFILAYSRPKVNLRVPPIVFKVLILGYSRPQVNLHYTSLLSFQGSYSRKFSASSQSTLHITPIVSSSSTLPSYRFKVLILGYARPKLNLHFASLLSFQVHLHVPPIVSRFLFSDMLGLNSIYTSHPSYRFKALILAYSQPKVNLHFPPIVSRFLFSEMLGLKSIIYSSHHSYRFKCLILGNARL